MADATIPGRILRLQALTMAWMSIEALAALAAAWSAHSPALLGFGGDSAVELLSAAVILWRFRSGIESPKAERWAARIAGGLLFTVAAVVVASAARALMGYVEPMPSVLGIALLIVAAGGMPWLAARKRALAAVAGSAALKADAAQSALCGYLSLIALAGLLVNSALRAPWADSLAALALVPFILKEAWEAVANIREIS